MKTIRVGVTGLRRAGKTVFLTSTIYNLLMTTGEHLRKFRKASVSYNGKELPPPRGTQRFDIEDKLRHYREKPPSWPEPTEDITGFQIELKLTCEGKRKKRHRLIFVDYPGERLLDTCLLKLSYPDWSDDVLRRFLACDGLRKVASEEYLTAIHSAVTPNATTGDVFGELCGAYGKFCAAVYGDGLVLPPTEPSVTKPDSLARAFCPLPVAVRNVTPTLAKRMEAAYDQYRQKTVRPFLEQIASCTHQIVLVDVLGILRAGQPERFNQARDEVGGVLQHFKYLQDGQCGIIKCIRNMWAKLAFRPPRVRNVIFCCTKADQAGLNTRPNLKTLLQELVRKSAQHIGYQAGLKRINYRYCAANCATTPGKADHHGQKISVLLGRVKGESSETEEQRYPGEVPVEWPNFAEDWGDCRFPDFDPRPLSPRDGAEIPHVNTYAPPQHGFT